MQTFETPTPISAVLDIPAGRVHLVATDRADTVVEVMPVDAAKGRDVKAAERTTVEYADGVLRIATTVKNEYLGPSGSVEVTVHLPTGSSVEAKAASAELRVEGRFGDVAFDGAHGTIEVDEAAGVKLTALAGDVSVRRLDGPAEISTAKGDIRIAEAVRGTVVLRTQAGDIAVSAAHGVSAALDASTSFGRIDNALMNTGDADLRIQATTAYGDIAARSL
ncbi:hypothetical protein Ais01nite_20040 [Asanoa ishikariensis]|uniref:Putative adhesin n=1 Tax=Asanoa ishikariensis TaxID=137265 RepID=A0A1H3UAC1_9ACTN|nr:DUF4097 family beta strand repeat-containing protein [Asanoa ishikariensis]GIF63969.1 hypothetical protein Ais01nite_20040 [Asanoa ishikariensis]SDZ59420.1 Putative adhesin [Asanoa ishikariensis]